MIWDLIRDFFVQYIFGGVDSGGLYYGGTIGTFLYADANAGEGSFDATASDFLVPVFKGVTGDFWNGTAPGSIYSGYISLGDWLSTTATIITLVIILVAIGLFIRWLFRLVSGLITFRG